MSELAWLDGRPRPLKPVGDCIMTRLADGTIHIDRADPRILIAAELLDEIGYGCNPYVILDGDVLKIHGANRTVVYRIGEKVPNMHAYYAEWPD